MTAAAPSPRRGLAREEAILSASFALIAELGYQAITVDALAARARVSKSTMYRRWPGGKPEIVAEALRRHAEGRQQDPPRTGSLRGDITAAVRGLVVTITGQQGGASLVGLVEGLRDDERLRELVHGQIEQGAERLSLAIGEDAHARGEAATPAEVALMLRVAVGCVLTTTLLTGVPPGRAEQRRLVDDVLMRLVSGAGAAAAAP